MFNVVLS